MTFSESDELVSDHHDLSGSRARTMKAMASLTDVSLSFATVPRYKSMNVLLYQCSTEQILSR